MIFIVGSYTQRRIGAISCQAEKLPELKDTLRKQLPPILRVAVITYRRSSHSPGIGIIPAN